MTFSSFRNIHLSDTDAAGVIYFAKGLAICHEAYESWLDSLGLNIGKMIKEGLVALPIVHAEIDYLQPIKCGDRVEVKLELLEVQQTQFKVIYEIFKPIKPNQILAKAQTVHVCINPKTRQRATLPYAIMEQ